MAQKPILYYATLSPPSRACLLTAKAIGIDLELKAISLFKGEHLTPEFVKMNPQHTIPLLDDNGIIIYDSHSICGYLCDKYAPDHSLYPKDLVKRANIDARLHFDSGFLFARLRFLFEPILYYGSTVIPDDKKQYIKKCYDLMEAFVKDSPYVCGPNITIADFCCVATISSGLTVVPIEPETYPKFTEWLKRMENLPYYDSLNRGGADEVQQHFWSKLKENQAKTE